MLIESGALQGGYIYFDVFSQQGSVDIIRLVGPNITAGGIGRPRLCMTFWFAAFGAGETTQLKIYGVDTLSKDQRGEFLMFIINRYLLTAC